MFGSHLSIAGGLHKALDEAARLGMDCVQIFTQNQRQWANRELTDEAVQRWRASRDSAGLASIVSHGSYLINLATPKTDLRRKSIDAVIGELARCEKLEIPLAVLHPGSHVGEGEQAGLERIVSAIDEVFQQLGEGHTLLCLETTAGAGSCLGGRFEQLRWILDHVAAGDRLGVCLDSAHMLEAGYDLTSGPAAEAVLAECRSILDPQRIQVVHLNDSKTPLGSHVDRHEHIGQGCIAAEAFAVLVNDARIRQIPKILETPKETTDDGRLWDEVNLQTLRQMMR